MFKSIAAASLLASGALASAQYGYGSGYGSGYAAPVYSSSVAAEAAMTTTTSCTISWPATTTTWAAGYTAAAEADTSPMTHTVTVGGTAGLVYTPEVVYGNVGDIVEFVFMSQNHSATQSAFDTPCIKLAGGMDSGLTPNPNNTVIPAPTFQYTIQATTPTWWYCKQKVGTHCGKGMVFAINPTAEKTFQEFQSMAIAQNGTATATSAAYAYTAPPTQSTVTLDAGSGYTTTAAVSAAATWVSGTGSSNGDSCNCQCFCGVAAWPSQYGINAYGGMPGSLPWSTSASAAPAAASTAAAGGYGYKI